VGYFDILKNPSTKEIILVHGELMNDNNNDNLTSCLQFSQQAKFTKKKAKFFDKISKTFTK
jgi:hypothetical protein